VPFALISNDVSADELVVMPAYWFLHNMYAIARNSWKYVDRDKRIDRTQLLEYDYLAPDTIGEMVSALTLLERYTGQALVKTEGRKGRYSEEELVALGAALLRDEPAKVELLEIVAEGWENSDRKVRLVKVAPAWTIYRELITYYAANQLLKLIREESVDRYEDLLKLIPASLPLQRWVNAGGQLIRENQLEQLNTQIRAGKIKSWEQVHLWYLRQGEQYFFDRLVHALAALKAVTGFSLRRGGPAGLRELLKESVAIKEKLTGEIYASRAKDYSNPFRKMVYESTEEMNAVVGRLQDNSFIRQEKEALKKYRREVEEVLKKIPA
jgi:hypothetical protein